MHRRDGADDAERDHQQHRDRDRPALVERGEKQEDDQDREGQKERAWLPAFFSWSDWPVQA